MILIEGLKDGPVKGEMCRLTLYGEGGVIQDFEDKSVIKGEWKTLEPHGDLIDRHRLLEKLRELINEVGVLDGETDMHRIVELVENSPTILSKS